MNRSRPKPPFDITTPIGSPGHTPDAPANRLVQTLGSALRHAHQMVGESERRRDELIKLALDRGASTREIAALLGVSNSTVWRWAGGRTRNPNALDQPLYPKGAE